MNTSHAKTNDPKRTTSPEKSQKTRMLFGVLLFCLVLAAGGFVAINTLIPRESPQQAIQALLEERAAAMSQKDLERYLRCFSQQYQDGEQRYEDLQTNASRWFAQFKSIQFSFQTLHLEIDDAQALVENNYKFSLQPDEGDILNISKRELLELRREQTGWKIFKNLKPQ